MVSSLTSAVFERINDVYNGRNNNWIRARILCDKLVVDSFATITGTSYRVTTLYRTTAYIIIYVYYNTVYTYCKKLVSIEYIPPVVVGLR